MGVFALTMEILSPWKRLGSSLLFVVLPVVSTFLLHDLPSDHDLTDAFLFFHQDDKLGSLRWIIIQNIPASRLHSPRSH